MENADVARIVHVSALSGYRLHVEFDDGTAGEVDLSDRLFGPVFEPLRNEDDFRRVSVDEYGAICWPCGADLAPNAIYRKPSQTAFSPSGSGLG